MDGHGQLVWWVVVAAVYALVSLLGVDRSPLRRAGLGLLERLGARVTAGSDEAEDPIAAEVRLAARRAWLRSNLERLRGLLARDAHMLATRQLANRLAYEQLRREVAALPEEPPWSPPVVTVPRDLTVPPGWAVAGTRGQVEYLDLR